MRKAALLIIVVIALAVMPSSAATRFDVVLILTDDQRWDTVQYMPNVQTLLANRGITFTNAFVTSPLCCPSRATILSGLYAHKHGVLDNDPPDGGAVAFRDFETIAVWLARVGYRTAFFGKYLNSYTDLGPYIPPGWSEWAAQGRGGSYYSYEVVNTGGVVTTHGTAPTDYSTTVFTNKAVSFIESTPSGTSLFLLFAPNAPHLPATPEPEDVGKFSGMAPWRPPSYNEVNVSDKPSWVRALPLLTESLQGDADVRHRRQVESLQAVDRGVSQIVDALSRTNRLSRTVIVFTSDNGFSWGEHRWMDNKQCPYEECIRVPLIVRDPGAFAIPHRDSSIVLNLDLAPSILQWAGETRPPYVLPGSSLFGLLRTPHAQWRRHTLLEMLGVRDPPAPGWPKYYGVRSERYVYIEHLNGEREFYDLALDPYQLQNAFTSPSYAATIAELRLILGILKQR